MHDQDLTPPYFHALVPSLEVDRSPAAPAVAGAVTWEEQAHLLDLVHVIIRDIDGTILFWNTGAEQMYGWSREEALGASSNTLLQTLFPQPLEQIESALFERGEWEGELTHRTKDGRRLVVASHWALHRDEKGRPRAILEVSNDITGQKQIEEERRYVMAGARCLLWYADIKESGGKYLDWKPRIPDMEAAQQFVPLEIREGETYMDAWYRCRLPEDRDPCDEIGMEAVRAGRSYEQEFRCRAADGTLRWLHEDIRVETVTPNRHWRAVGVCTDITERRQAEEALRTRQAEIEALNERLRRAMAETHHRVKNNLQVISALVDLQSMAHAEAVPVAELQRMSQHIRALASIHDLLTHSAKIDADTETVSTRAAIERLLPMLEPMFARRGVSMRIDDIRLPARQVTALAILVNELVSNAAKHGEGSVEITLTARADSARLEVCDNGPGFPPDFDSHRAANTGLQLVESVASWDLQGSTIYANRPEGGARVTVTFPLTIANTIAE